MEYRKNDTFVIVTNKRIMESRIIISKAIEQQLSCALTSCACDKLFVLMDKTTYALCWPKLEKMLQSYKPILITIEATDTHKDIDSLMNVWKILSDKCGTRQSCLLNLGGGMVTDLGGFAASTFKRGINFINIPTTLLAMVDASVGGKTGINFNGLKNEIGMFNDSRFVLIDTLFLKTLDSKNLCSGYAEMLKHGLISDEKMWKELISFSLFNPDFEQLQRMVSESIQVKEKIVEQDPHEQNIRKALNFGHTFGHAFESWSLSRKPILHGYAVAYGMICELYLSCIKSGFPTEKMRATVRFIREHFGYLPITCDDYDELITLMTHDKKNRNGIINFTLLGEIGDIHINQTATKDEIKETLDFFREG